MTQIRSGEIRWRFDSLMTMRKRSVMFNHSARVKNVGLRLVNRIPAASDLPFEGASDPTTSSFLNPLTHRFEEYQTKLTWEVILSLLSQRNSH